MPVFLAAFLGLFGVGAAQAAPIGAALRPDTDLLAFALVLGLLIALLIHRALPGLRVGHALKLATVFLVIGAGAAHAETVDFSPLARAAVDDFAVPVFLAVAPTVAAILVLPLKRYLDERSASDLAGRLNDVFDKGIAFAARDADQKLDSGTLDLKANVDGLVAGMAASYANDHAPALMMRAGGLAGDKLKTLLEQKALARLGGHPDVLALKGKIASRTVGAPLQLAGAA